MKEALKNFERFTCGVCEEQDCIDCCIDLEIIRVQERHEMELRKKDREIQRLTDLFKEMEIARQNIEELQEYICDSLCRYPCTCRNEEHLMEVCEECQVEEMLEMLKA